MDIYSKVLRNVDELTDYYSSKKDGFDAVVLEFSSKNELT